MSLYIMGTRNSSDCAAFFRAQRNRGYLLAPWTTSAGHHGTTTTRRAGPRIITIRTTSIITIILLITSQPCLHLHISAPLLLPSLLLFHDSKTKTIASSNSSNNAAIHQEAEEPTATQARMFLLDFSCLLSGEDLYFSFSSFIRVALLCTLRTYHQFFILKSLNQSKIY